MFYNNKNEIKNLWTEIYELQRENRRLNWMLKHTPKYNIGETYDCLGKCTSRYIVQPSIYSGFEWRYEFDGHKIVK